MAREMSGQAGRELDAKVAERVMGWERVEFLRDMLPGTFFIHDDRGVVAVINDKFNEFTPSTSIAAAWEVVAALEGNSMFLTLNRNQIPNEANGQQSKWDAYFWDNDKQMAHDVTASTVPLAICLAALKAVKSPP